MGEGRVGSIDMPFSELHGLYREELLVGYIVKRVESVMSTMLE